jgi:hypothetical protein
VAARRGVDILTLVRRPRGFIAEVARDPLTRRLMRRLFRAGLSENQPYFKLEESTPRGWFTLDHHPSDLPPQRQPLMVVSDFEPPPVVIDMALWRRLQRAMAGTAPIATPLWHDFIAMFHTAVRLTEHQTRGRRSSERVQADTLLANIEANAAEFQALALAQPEVADDIANLLFSITGESVGDTDDTVIQFEKPPVVPPVVQTRRRRLDKPEVSRQYVEQVLTKEPVLTKKRRPRRKWPEATEHDLREAAKLLESEPDPDEVSERVADTEPSDKSTRRPRRKWPVAIEEEDDLRAVVELAEFNTVEAEPAAEHTTDEGEESDPPNTEASDPDLAPSADPQPEVEEFITEEIDLTDAQPAETQPADEPAAEATEASGEPSEAEEFITEEIDIDSIGPAPQLADLEAAATIEAPLAAEAFEPDADPSFYPEPDTAGAETVAEQPSHAEKPDVALTDVPQRQQPDRDEEEVVEDDEPKPQR